MPRYNGWLDVPANRDQNWNEFPDIQSLQVNLIHFDVSLGSWLSPTGYGSARLYKWSGGAADPTPTKHTKLD